jgi:hypothetical protein
MKKIFAFRANISVERYYRIFKGIKKQLPADADLNCLIA